MKRKLGISQIGLFVLFGLSLFDLDARWMAVLLILCGALLFMSEKREWRPIPSVSLLIVAYLAGYAMPVLLFPEGLGRMPSDGVDRMMQWALRGFVVFSLAYSMSAKRGVQENIVGTGRQARQISYASFAYLALGAIAVAAWTTSALVYGVALTFVKGQDYGAGSGTMRQVLGLFSDMKYAYLLGYLLLRSAGYTRRIHLWVLLATLSISLIEIMLIGSKAAIIKLLVVAILSVTLGSAGRLRWSNILGGALAAIVCILSFSIIAEYRYIVRSAAGSGQEATDVGLRYQAFRRATVATISDSGPVRETEVGRSDIVSRFGSGAFGLGWILEFTQGTSPHENAINSAITPVHAFIPRFLWEDKPIFFNSGRFASEYFGWKYGGISISLLGSLYFAWGYTGILVGMAIAGFAMARLISRVERQGFIAVNSVVCLTILILHLLDVGAEFQPVVVNLTRTLVLLVVIKIIWRIRVSRNLPYSAGNSIGLR